MPHLGERHRNPRTGLECICPWGGAPLRRTASQQVRKIRNQNQKVFRDKEGQQFLERLEALLDAHPEIDAMAPWMAAQYKRGDLKLDERAEGSGIAVEANGVDINHLVPRFKQWWTARQHPLRRGVNIMEMDLNQVNTLASELQQAVREKQERENWLRYYGDHVSDDPKHVFGPEHGELEGWQVHKIRHSGDAEAETEALGHCIGSSEQPYCHNIDQGNITAWSLRDPDGYPHVSWHHNPDGTLAHIQGKSGYPKQEYRDLISHYNNHAGLHDDEGGSGEDRTDQLEPGEEDYDYHVIGPDIRDMEDYVRYLGPEGHNNIMEWAWNAGRYNLPEDGDWVETEPGYLDWNEIARNVEDMHTPKWGDKQFEYEGEEDDEEYDFHRAISENGHDQHFERALVGSQWPEGGQAWANAVAAFEQNPTAVARAPNAMASWLHHNNHLDRDEWIPISDPRRQTGEPHSRAPEFPQAPTPPTTQPPPPPPGQMTLLPGQPVPGQIGQPVPIGRQGNILDPIHDGLDPLVFDQPNEREPKLKERHRKWLTDKIYRTLIKHGYNGMERWLSLVFTGSLTTYQYSDESDVDVSLFVDAKSFPEWSRADMIGVMVENLDGTKLPGTPHPIQVFVVPPDVAKEDLYKSGLRSGYDLDADQWIIPPEKGRVHDVKVEMNSAYVHAMMQADKMERLLQYEPDKAVIFWHQIHKRRRRDQQSGKGDYSDSNITYKMLANRNLFPAISEVSGEYIAKAAGIIPPAESVERARQQLGLQHPVRVLPTYKNRGGYAGLTRDPMSGKPSHLVYVNPEQQPGPRNWSLWHELGHAQRIEQGGQFEPNNDLSDEEYRQHPNELHAEEVANQYADDDLYRTARETLPQQQRRWDKIWREHGLTEPHTQPNRIHDFDNGWHIMQHDDANQVNAVGRMMNNCWQGTKQEHFDEQDYEGWKYHSLHDEHGIPRAAWYVEDNPWNNLRPQIRQALGTRNQPLAPAYQPMLKQWAEENGIEPNEHLWGNEVPAGLQAQLGEPQRVGKTRKMDRPVRKWVFKADGNQLVMGEMGPEEGVLPNHIQLAAQAGISPEAIDHLGTINERGYVSFERGSGDSRSRFLAQQALKGSLGDQIRGFLGGEQDNLWQFGSTQAQSNGEVRSGQAS